MLMYIGVMCFVLLFLCSAAVRAVPVVEVYGRSRERRH